MIHSQKSQNPTRTTDVWETARRLLDRENERKQTGQSRGYTTLDQIIESENIGSRTDGRLMLQVLKELDQANYGQFPLCKLRHLVQLATESERKAFMASHDVGALSVRQLHATIKCWKTERQAAKNPNTAPSSSPTERQPDTETVLHELIDLLREQQSLAEKLTRHCRRLTEILKEEPTDSETIAMPTEHSPRAETSQQEKETQT